MARGKWLAVVLLVGVIPLGGCNSGESSEPVTCMGSGHVSVCSPGESDSRWLSVQDAQPSSSVTWTIGGETKALQMPNGDGPLRIDLPDRTSGTPVPVVVTGTDLRGVPFSETVTVG